MVIGLFNATWNSLAMITLRRGGRHVRRWRPKPENEKKFRGLRQMQVTRRSAGGDTASTSRRVPSYIDIYKERNMNIVGPILNIVARVGSLVLNILRMFAGRDASVHRRSQPIVIIGIYALAGQFIHVPLRRRLFSLSMKPVSLMNLKSASRYQC